MKMMAGMALGVGLVLGGCGGTADLYPVPAAETTERIRISASSVEVREVSLPAYAASDGADPSDVLFAIGSSVYGVSVPPPAKKAKTANGGTAAQEEEEADPILDFDYMKKFMYEVFLSYGVTPERAEVCSDVLIESDKRGIDSHGLGRLKPIYVS